MKRHRADLVSLFFGLVFVTAAGWWAITYFYNVRLDVPNFGWFAAGALILVGVLGIVASLRRDGQHTDIDEVEAVPEPALVSPITTDALTDTTEGPESIRSRSSSLGDSTYSTEGPESIRSRSSSLGDSTYSTPTWRLDLPEPPRSEPSEPPAAQGDEVPPADTEETSGGWATGESPR